MTEQEIHINGRTVSASILYKRRSTGTRAGGLSLRGEKRARWQEGVQLRPVRLRLGDLLASSLRARVPPA